jgi:hypothetical protein
MPIEATTDLHGPFGESGEFGVRIATGGRVDLYFDGKYDHNGVRVTGPNGMANQVEEGVRGWGGGEPTATVKGLAHTAFNRWLEQFNAQHSEAGVEE